MYNTYDTPTYPELGNIYPGDYYEALPYDEFIDKNQKLPEGKKVFDIRDFGARPEKNLLNTEAFLKAAAACEKEGGGVILVAWALCIFRLTQHCLLRQILKSKRPEM